MKPFFKILLILSILSSLFFTNCSNKRSETQILVFSKTEGWRHASIGAGKTALLNMGKENGFKVDTTENADLFTEENLTKYSAVVFLNTTKDVLNHRQQRDFERYIQAGGGFVGIHAASDTEYDWPWFGGLVGAYFTSHPNNPNVQTGMFKVVDTNHPSTAFRKGKEDWERTDEFYNFKDINPAITPVIKIDESTYDGGENGAEHPMAWYHEYDGGRAFYTNFGHTKETFSDPEDLKHILGGIQYAIGENLKLDYSKATSLRVPDENRFAMQVLAERLNEPLEMEVMRDGRVMFVERRGDVKLFDPETKTTKVIAKIDVHTVSEDGLLGLALDPDYYNNHYLYLYFSPAGERAINVLARYKTIGDSIVLGSQKIMLEVGTQREECCHTGGSIEFGADGLMYLSTGDNTNPFETRYAPINEMSGRNPWDGQKSSANTNDLRGKVLRIKPTKDGGYEIPEGNLFPKDGSGGRPEIYVMGCRNPYRISIDAKTNFVYWGDVGPDGRVDSSRGPMGYDEVNQARKPGFFGWPLFIGNNKPYRDYDFAAKKEGELFDPEHPINNSPNNTGAQELPPAQPAFIYYPYSESKEFPIVGKGGRNAMAGPVYYSDMFKGAPSQFPEYYNGKLFIYDFMRDWVFLVTMNEAGDLQEIEPFLENIKLSSPMDMMFGPDGALYILEYGTQWFAQNADARLIKIDYSVDNRAPIAKMETDINVGAAPLTVKFSGADSYDHDEGDEMKYAWKFSDEEDATAEGVEVSYTFNKPGIYRPTLTVTDKEGKTNTAEVGIQVGNQTPEIKLSFLGNQSFFDNKSSVDYVVDIVDKEDGMLSKGEIKPEAVSITFDYLESSKDETLIAQGHEATANASMIAAGEAMIADVGCIACHGIESKILGPAYLDVSKKYQDQKDPIAYLSGKILNGSSGVWGGQAMPAQAQLTKDQAQTISAFILSLANKKPAPPSLKPSGKVSFNKHKGAGIGSTYNFKVSYQDKGGNDVGPLRAIENLTLRSTTMLPEDFDLSLGHNVAKRTNGNNVDYGRFREDAYLSLGIYDWTGVESITIYYGTEHGGISGELRKGSVDGEIVGSSNLASTGNFEKFQKVTINLNDIEGFHELFLVAKNADGHDETNPDWMHLSKVIINLSN